MQNKDREIDYRAEAEKAHLKRSALSEIDRMRRIDEWIPSYRNVHTRAALRGLVDLMQLKIIPKRTSAFLPYTRPGNQDEVRLEAFEHLIKLGMMAQDSFFRYIFSTLASEPSAYFRERLWQRIHRGLSSIALGETDLSKTPEPVNNGDGLVIENGPAPQVRQEVVDKTSIDGGLKWLRLQLKDNKALQESLMDALRYVCTHVLLRDTLLTCLQISNYRHQRLRGAPGSLLPLVRRQRRAALTTSLPALLAGRAYW